MTKINFLRGLLSIVVAYSLHSCVSDLQLTRTGFNTKEGSGTYTLTRINGKVWPDLLISKNDNKSFTLPDFEKLSASGETWSGYSIREGFKKKVSSDIELTFKGYPYLLADSLGFAYNTLLDNEVIDKISQDFEFGYIKHGELQQLKETTDLLVPSQSIVLPLIKVEIAFLDYETELFIEDIDYSITVETAFSHNDAHSINHYELKYLNNTILSDYKGSLGAVEIPNQRKSYEDGIFLTPNLDGTIDVYIDFYTEGRKPVKRVHIRDDDTYDITDLNTIKTIEYEIK